METFDPASILKLFQPSPTSHKGENGKLMIIGGSHLFHAASLWALTVASHIVDMVFYSSVPENNQIVHDLKKEFRNGIIVPRDQIEAYIDEADSVLIGPGMLRSERRTTNDALRITNLREIGELKDEGEQSYHLTKYLLEKYPAKKWVIDAGALQMLDPVWLKPLGGNVVLTPHPKELARLESGITNQESRSQLENKSLKQKIETFVATYGCIMLLKGHEDIICSPEKCVKVAGGNAGMTKGGTGDVLAGLVAALACNNDLFLAATAGSYINKKAGDRLFERVGYYFNASDLADEIPAVMKELLII